MLLELAIAACIAFAAAGATLAAFRLAGRRAPMAVVLAAAGLGLFAYTQWERYTWADRTAQALPPTMAVVMRLPDEAPLEFWTRWWPRDGGLVAVDRAATATNPHAPDIRMARMLLLERRVEVIAMRQFVDCAGLRRAPATQPGDDLPPDEAWIDGGTPRGLFAAACPPVQR